jgi:hypothetical protein
VLDFSEMVRVQEERWSERGRVGWWERSSGGVRREGRMGGGMEGSRREEKERWE